MAVYLFFDESGNLDFGPKGTRYFCVGTLATRAPAALERALGALRDELLAEGVELEAFHAAEDRQAVRDRVFAALTAVGEFEVDALVVDKAGVPAELREEARFYPECAERLLAPVFARFADPRERVVVVTDRLPLNRTRQAVEKAFKLFIRRRLGARPFGVLHHASAAHAGLQAADSARSGPCIASGGTGTCARTRWSSRTCAASAWWTSRRTTDPWRDGRKQRPPQLPAGWRRSGRAPWALVIGGEPLSWPAARRRLVTTRR